MYQSVANLLEVAKVEFSVHTSTPQTLLTAGNQIIGTYENLREFQLKKMPGGLARQRPECFGWHAHHIFENQDFGRLGVAAIFPRYEKQACVLLPPAAHTKRINSILTVHNPRNVKLVARDLLDAYKSAYDMMGDYCGGGEALIKAELLKIVNVTLSLAGF
jgi:hypothetical protein